MASGIFDGIDISWSRIGRKDLEEEVMSIIDKYDFKDPAQSVPALIDLRRKVKHIDDEFWKRRKIEEIDDIIKASLGLYIEATSGKSYLSPQDEIEVQFEMTNRSEINVVVNTLSSQDLNCDTLINARLENNTPLAFSLNETVKDGVSETSPYWLANPVKDFKYETFTR